MEWGWDNARAFLGIAMIFAIAWGLSENKKAFPWKLVLGAVAIQFGFALILFGIPIIREALFAANIVVDSLIAATAYGTNFVFGPVFGTQAGWEELTGQPGPIFAVHLLPLIIVVAALSAILWHWHILRWVTKGFASIFRRFMGLGGATSLAVSANVFMGMTEAPVLIKPYIKGMTRSEIFILMTAGFATVAGSVLVLYGVFLQDVLPNALGQLLAASLIAAPAAVALALVMIPETVDEKQRAHEPDFEYESTMDAFATGASDGLKILANIVTMLIAAFALLYLVNAGLGALPEVGGAKLSIERILGWVFAPIMYMVGVPLNEAAQSGSLIGIKTVLTEFVAFLQLSGEAGEGLSERSAMITAHAICGFANFGSIGILIGGLSIIEPSRRSTFLELAWKTLVAGTLATCLSGAVVGALPANLFFGG
ncbi:nucleoside transporter C-terminal domain-containing protein [Hyphomonas sp. FCG-A18]|uniref:NupC/NupG family nucleoside CNT transporter n=1 Tax=Hyphomonas sp. FCG-A18 TaxID=3080019 RepID=UPI002B2A4A91|nr:nucleoside transporter C-terminal domain-containing protein [Hyphomonas sp. FCG-A18]